MKRTTTLTLIVLLLATSLAGCLGGGSSDQVQLKQTGSSTVLPLAEVWAAEFTKASVSVSGGGSSHGINALLKGEADLGDASRKISPGDYQKVKCSVSESRVKAAQTGDHPWQYPKCNGVTPTEWVVAYDMLTVVVNPQNDWVNGLNYTQLRAIFMAGEDKAVYWDDVPGLEDAPHKKIQIFAPDSSSGTYEFFFEEIAGDHGPDNSRLAKGDPAYTGSSKDTVIVNAISSQKHAIGFFGFAYYDENRKKVKALPIAEEGTDHVAPSFDTVDEYPISRPLHIYTDGIPGGSKKGNATQAYLQYILSEEGQSVVPNVGYVKVRDVNAGLADAQRAALG